MPAGSSPVSPPASPLRLRALTRTLAQAPTLHHALLLLLALEPRVRFDSVRRDGDRIRVLFRLGPPRDALLALDAETNGALCDATLLDDPPEDARARPAYAPRG